MEGLTKIDVVLDDGYIVIVHNDHVRIRLDDPRVGKDSVGTILNIGKVTFYLNSIFVTALTERQGLVLLIIKGRDDLSEVSVRVKSIDKHSTEDSLIVHMSNPATKQVLVVKKSTVPREEEEAKVSGNVLVTAEFIKVSNPKGLPKILGLMNSPIIAPEIGYLYGKLVMVCSYIDDGEVITKIMIIDPVGRPFMFEIGVFKEGYDVLSVVNDKDGRVIITSRLHGKEGKYLAEHTLDKGNEVKQRIFEAVA